MTNLINKYRPTTFDQFVGQKKVVESIKSIVSRYKQKGEILPHMIFYGSPGIGKTTMSYIIAREYFGNESGRIAEFNASDERGIDIIREKILPLSKSVSKKIVLLDEADELTSDAQHALRRIMETTDSTTFIFTANNPTKIIEPLRSRCIEFSFAPLSREDMRELVINIMKRGEIKFPQDAKKQDIARGIDYLIDISRGDARVIIQNLEQVIDSNGYVDVKKIMIESPVSLIENIISEAISGDFNKAKNDMETAIVIENYDSLKIVDELFDKIYNNQNLTDEQKAFLLIELALTEDRIRRGNNPVIQLVSYISFIYSSIRVKDLFRLQAIVQ
jgi:replication factor C small subunit